ncbi:hypothetical protein BCR41DRAFT_422876 [Lobosporangium transversale]|nr:hypothetical protein BCR41DRAFT_422876 [Lobosporangium transversale]ORZ13365.1 hypothetical protein BCR41DRAFT_422876 [Lobosporangium transversale]|eukprot:XP_021880446.1 hypothetical protein BCR41DRAFT_422876 [Lobosporangium transversale]
MRLLGAARSRKKALDEVLDSTGYSFRLATLLLSGQGGPNSAYSIRATNGPSTDIIKAALQERNVDILWVNEDTKRLLERILPLNNPSKTAMLECIQGTKGVLIQALFCDIGGDRMVHGYRDKVSLQSQDKDITRFKLKGTIPTNSLVLNLQLSQGFLNTTCSKAADEDLTDEDYANINWKRSSKLLENVELTFNEPERCPSANTTTIVGCDPGIVNVLTFSSLDPHNPNLRQTVKVRSRFLYLPVLRFNHLLNKRKREKGMIEVESAIPVFGRDTYNEYF